MSLLLWCGVLAAATPSKRLSPHPRSLLNVPRRPSKPKGWDSDYSVEQLPWGRNGRFPDQLVPPSEPSDLVYGVVRLTLHPRPCNAGVAMIQLARPLDDSDSLQVVTYDAKGEMRGNYPGLTELPGG